MPSLNESSEDSSGTRASPPPKGGSRRRFAGMLPALFLPPFCATETLGQQGSQRRGSPCTWMIFVFGKYRAVLEMCFAFLMIFLNHILVSAVCMTVGMGCRMHMAYTTYQS